MTSDIERSQARIREGSSSRDGSLPRSCARRAAPRRAARMGAGSRAPHADEQPRSRRRGASRRISWCMAAPASRARWRHSTRSRARFACWADDRDATRAVGQTGRRIHRPHPMRRCHRHATSLGAFHMGSVFFAISSADGLIMYGQMTRDHGSTSGRRESCKDRSKRWVRWPLAHSVIAQGRIVLTGGLGGMGGAQRWRHHERRNLPRRRGRSVACGTASAGRVISIAPRRRWTGAGMVRGRERRGSAMSVAWSATAPMSCRAHQPEALLPTS